MRFIGRFFISLISNTLAILAAGYFVTGFEFSGDFISLITAALILSLINAFIRPVLKLFFGPLILLTLGLFVIVINSLTLYFLDILVNQITIVGTESLIISTLIFSLVNAFIYTFGRWAFKR